MGSTFFAVIPRVFDPAAIRARKPAGSNRALIAARSGAAAPLEKALIVDDADQDRYLIREALTALGRFESIEADRGEDALALARATTRCHLPRSQSCPT